MSSTDGPDGLRHRIAGELQWHSGADATRVEVSVVNGGVIVLDGIVHTYAEKCSIEEVLKRVPGVAGVRNRLEVRLTIGDYRTDETLMRVIGDVIESLARMPAERPVVSVVSGWVTLDGSVSRPFQKQLIESIVREVAGVRGITNKISVVPGAIADSIMRTAN